MVRLLIPVLIFVISSCTSVHFRHKGTLKMKNGELKKFIYEKGYSTGNLPTYCAISAIFYGGYCWKYRYLPTLEQKASLLNDSEVALNKKFKSGEYKIIKDEISRESWALRGEELVVYKDDGSEDNDTEKDMVQKELNRIASKKQRFDLQLLFRNQGVGVMLGVIVNPKSSFGITYIDQGGETGRRGHQDDFIKSAQDFGVAYNWYFDQTVSKTGFYLSPKAIYSQRTVYSSNEDFIFGVNRPKNEIAYYFETHFGIRYVFLEDFHIDFQVGKGVELGERKSNRTNYASFESLLGYVF